MFVLDTNVISELMRSNPHPAVFAWTAAQPRHSLYTTSINCAEILFGIQALPDGKRRSILAETATAMFAEDFKGRILSIDAAVAARHSQIVVDRRRAGDPIEAFDALIAAAACVAGAAVATRDMRGFRGCGLEVVDPWA